MSCKVIPESFLKKNNIKLAPQELNKSKKCFNPCRTNSLGVEQNADEIKMKKTKKQ